VFTAALLSFKSPALFDTEDEGTRILRNSCDWVIFDTMQHRGRLKSSARFPFAVGNVALVL
jgi:hypothetical protein